MLYVRDDDVLVNSEGFKDPEGRFRGFHNEVFKHGAMHRPAILITEILDYPDTIDFIKEKTGLGEMEPQFHGYKHIDYARVRYLDILDHIQIGKRMFDRWGLPPFTRFYTPWGANTEFIKMACKAENVELVDCRHNYLPVSFAKKDTNATPEKYNGVEVATHWWEKGMKGFITFMDKVRYD